MARCSFGLLKKSIQQFLNQKIHQLIEKGKDELIFNIIEE
jgi:hypothetical protein